MTKIRQWSQFRPHPLGLLLLWATLARAAVSGPPYVIAVDPPPGPRSWLTQITFTFNEPITNVVHNSLRVNGNGALNRPSAVGGAVITFTFQPPAWGSVQVSLSGLKDLDATPNTMAATNWTYTLVDTDAPRVTNVFPRPGATVRRLSQLEVFFSEPVQGVEAADLLVNGTPATNLLRKPGGALTFQFVPPSPGPVEITWSAAAGIVDYAPAPNRFAATNLWTFQLDTNLAYADLAITEICAANRAGLADEDGLAADWLEILNRGSSAVDLAGWSLSDDPLEPGKWVFPSRMLQPGAYLILFASGKDRRAPVGANALHLSFTLSAGGEFLGLFSPESPRALASGFAPAFPEQRNDYSWGLDAAGQWRYFAAPTPGAPNPASAITNVCAPVHFSAARGFYTQPFDLLLTTRTPGAVIRYTTDGHEPGPGRGTIYSGPIRLSASTVVRAAAFHADLAPSLIHTHTYLFNASDSVRALPVLSLVTPQTYLTGPQGITGIGGGAYVNSVWTPLTTNDYNNNLNRGLAWERPVSAELIRPEDNSGFQVDCGLRVNGSDYMRPRYTTASKFSYRLYFRGDYGETALHYPLFPTSSVQGYDAIVLRGGHNDQTNPFLKDELSRRLFQEAGHPASQGTFVNLFINGQYKGYYNPCERITEDALEAWEGPPDWDRVSIASSVQEGDRAVWDELFGYFNTAQDLTQPPVFQAVAQRLDLTNFVDYLLLEGYAANNDWPENNWLAARPRVPGGQYGFHLWDVEQGFTSGNVNANFFTDTGALAGPSEIARLYRGLLPSPEFRLLWADRVQKHFFNQGAYSGENFTNHFNAMKAQLAGVIPAINQSILTDWVPNRRAPCFTQFNTYGLYASNAPVFNLHGGRVARGFILTMAAPLGGAIYCTLDGTDPRVPFTGAVAASAVAYTNGLVLDASVQVRARTWNGSSWSPLSEAQFQVAALGVPLAITEINYSPPGGSAYEFLELRNVGTVALDLTGLFFDEGITYNFPHGTTLPPGEMLVLANNADPAAFAARYPGVSVFGWFGGNLENRGERLTLKSAAGVVLWTLDYDNAGGWPTAADGQGPSLEILDPLGNLDDPANWRASADPFGSPGVLPAPPAPPSVRLNEIMADNRGAVSNGGVFPDWVELHNAGSTDTDLGGWSLSDDADSRKFVFPPNTPLPAGGFLVAWGDTNTAAPGWHTGFALGANGDHLVLFDAHTQRVDALSFGPQMPNYTLGRLDDGWGLAWPTPQTTNLAAPLDALTNVVLNEWLANPPPGQPDWLELHNRGAQPVALRGCYLAVGQAVQRITSHMFIAPGGFVRLFADQGVGPDHLDFKLTAAGDTMALYDPLANLLDSVAYAAQAEGVSRGRFPDGAESFTNFVGTASPGASNYVNAWTGPVFNEVLARNAVATHAGFVELFNPTATNFDLDGFSVSVDRAVAGQWGFPPGTEMTAGGHLLLGCDASRPASQTPGDFNLGTAFEGDSGGAYLFNPAGQLVEFIEYGPQIEGLSIGRSGGRWRLLAAPTPGETNAAALLLGTNTALRLNEWMAASTNGPDWLELYNATNRPIELTDLYLTDDPSTVGLTKFRIAPLSFIGSSNWVRFIADNDPEQGRHHVNFNLNDDGEGLWVVRTNGASLTVLDTVSFALQTEEIAQGRWPDGAALVVSFPGTASPRAANYVAGPPQLVVVPTNLAVRAGSTMVLTVGAVGVPPLNFQWRCNGVELPGETNATFMRASVAFADAGLYQVEVCNLAGCVSASATVSVILAPVITQPPLPLTVAPGERVTLSVGVAGYPPPFTYEWRRLATPIQTNTSDATMDFLTVIAPSYPTQQNFRVIVKNPANPVGVASAFAILTVAADTDADGLPDPWELAYGFPTNSAASRGLDSDGDGLTDYDEYRAGTNPTDASSCLRLEGLVADTNALLTFTAQSNRTYTILWGDTLNLLNGQRLADVPASPTQQLYQLSVPLLRVGNRFFRITTPRLSPP